MSEKVVSTAYSQATPPFQIIYYNGTLGMQIGTLIVTTQKENTENNEYAISTHSHPVVIYMDKNYQSELVSSGINWTHSLHFPVMEGVIWNNVEVRDVTTICFSNNSKLDWNYYCTMLWRLTKVCEERFSEKFPLSIVPNYLMNALIPYGVQVTPPAPGSYEINLYKKTVAEGRGNVIYSAINDILPIYCPYKSNKMLHNNLKTIMMNYCITIGLGTDINNPEYTIVFKTEDETLMNIVEQLNTDDGYKHLTFPVLENGDV